MLVHFNAERTNATVLSIPRDLWVTVPECDGASASDGRFNEAFSRGGPACTVKAVTELTGLPVHHVAVVDFRGFKDIVNALGGLEVCLRKPLSDEKAGLDLPAGPQLLNGKDALALARARYAVGDGSDLSRINRQQQVVAALLRQVSSSGLLTDPVALYKVADAGLSAISVDKGLNEVPEAVEFLAPLAGLGVRNVEFVTWPWIARSDGATVATDAAAAEPLATAIAEDRIPVGKQNGSRTEAKTPTRGICKGYPTIG